MQNIKKIAAPLTAGALLLTFVFSVHLPVWAGETEEMENELQSINQRIEEQAGKVREIKGQMNDVTTQLSGVEAELRVQQGALGVVEKKMDVTRQEIERNRQLMAEAERRIADRTQVLNKRTRDIYEHGQISYADVLFGSSDFIDFTTRYELLRRVMAADLALINRVKADRELIAVKKAALEQDMALQEKLRKEATDRRNLIAQKRQQKQSILDRLATDKDAAEQEYQQLANASRQIENMLRDRRPGGGPSGSTGSYIWPASGPITSDFGWRTHPIFGTAILHSGIDIGADYGDTIAAADGGQIVSAGWIDGYGNTIIIQHNATYSTLYAHCSEILVNEGQNVRKGQAIGRVGATGYATGPHLHFEVRVNGSPVNPISYLP